MKKHRVMILTLAGLCFIFAGIAIAENKPTEINKPASATNNKSNGLITKCPNCAKLIANINAKKEEKKAIEGKIKVLSDTEKAKRDTEKAKKETERQAKLEQLKIKGPKKYEELMAKEAERQKKQQEMGQNNPKGSELTNEQRRELLKERNPEMYQLVLQKDQLDKELKLLDKELKNCKNKCVAANKAKK